MGTPGMLTMSLKIGGALVDLARPVLISYCEIEVTRFSITQYELL